MDRMDRWDEAAFSSVVALAGRCSLSLGTTCCRTAPAADGTLPANPLGGQRFRRRQFARWAWGARGLHAIRTLWRQER